MNFTNAIKFANQAISQSAQQPSIQLVRAYCVLLRASYEQKSYSSLNSYFFEAISILEFCLSPSHPYSVVLYKTMAEIQFKLSCFDKALELLIAAFNCTQRNYGLNHTNSAEILHTLGDYYHAFYQQQAADIQSSQTINKIIQD